ncbi:carboxypeptidase-like regulatory domain-containing protein [Planctomycetes bacterium K23_9]|uniref:Carboxypeptidase regulatory-like domain-containing protein n=1 Tax=Stieleria marina TaxID=1930275 RepID=A0A517P093_9BACT|nr:hypothetical protein K239x_48090 [Planctomycetes bacterium K23_9]
MCTRVCVFALSLTVVSSIARGDDAPIHGTCLDNTGKRVVGATATLYHSVDQQSEINVIETVTTDKRGGFRFSPLAVEVDQHGGTRYLVTVTTKNHASFSQRVHRDHLGRGQLQVRIHKDPATLVGHLTGPDGKPVVGAKAFLPSGFNYEPIAGVLSATTDAKGVFRISDMKPWRPDNPGQRRMNLLIDHPDFARTSTMFESVPQVLRVQLDSPAIVTGRVVDAVTNKPAVDIIVSAQGVADSGWGQTRTDADGKYELRLTADRYNIWAEMDERIAIAVDSVKATPGQAVVVGDIRMVRGAIVYGNVGVGGETGNMYVAHYGPARPRSGAAVTSTKVQADGSYRLRVAPGMNYLYVMGGGGSITVDVTDGEELVAHFMPGKTVYMVNDAEKKRQADALLERRITDMVADAVPSRDRGDTQVAELLDLLEVFQEREFLFKEPWLQTLRDLVDCGPDAVPELIAELDATESNIMFRCMGFAMRAIGDRRAVPALIRSIPRVYLTHGSDMGLQTDNPKLADFARKHDLDDSKDGNRDRYKFGRPIREVFGAIQVLTEHDFDDSQVFRIRPTGTAAQQELKRELMERHAAKWADWWTANAAKLNVPKKFHEIGLPPVVVAKITPVALGVDYRSCAMTSNSLLEPVQAKEPYRTFIDLDTGRKGTLPAKWRDTPRGELPLEEIATWARSEGFDLMGTEFSIDDQKNCFSIRLLGCRALQLPDADWKKRFSQVRLEELVERGKPIGEYLFRQDGGEIDHLGQATFLLVTAEETPVLLYLDGIAHHNKPKPAGFENALNDLKPVAVRQGRRFGMQLFERLNN